MSEVTASAPPAPRATGGAPRATGERSAAGVFARGSAEARLLASVMDLAGRDGYAQLSVERVLASAGVCRASFYRYFSNLEDCFWSAYRLSADALVREATLASARSARHELAILEALFDFARAHPHAARLTMREGLAAGPAGLLERDALIARLAQAGAERPASRRTLDLPRAILIGGLFRFLSLQLEQGPLGEDLRGAMLEWAEAFVRHPEDCWSERLMPQLEPRAQAPGSPGGRSSDSARERILRATTECVRAKGFLAVTVADIVAGARVSRRGFYNEFPNRAAAFVAAYESAFEQTVAACAPAFFSSAPWPERVWESALGFTSFLAREPSFAYLGFVDCYAVGDFVGRVHDTQLAFGLFLEEGYRQRPAAASLPRICSPLTTEVIFEAGFQVCRAGPSLYLRRMQPLAVYIALTPFLGSDRAGEFVAARLAQPRR